MKYTQPDPGLLAAISNVFESAPARGGDYVVVDHNSKVHGKHKDSGPAIRQASKLEDDTGYIHQVHRVLDGKIDKTWEWSDSQQKYAPHTDYKGEDAKHLMSDDADGWATAMLKGKATPKPVSVIDEGLGAMLQQYKDKRDMKVVTAVGAGVRNNRTGKLGKIIAHGADGMHTVEWTDGTSSKHSFGTGERPDEPAQISTRWKEYNQ